MQYEMSATNTFARCLAGLMLLLCSLAPRAAPITATVTVGDMLWAQPNLFTNLSWNDMAAVCAGGPCGAQSLNGWDMQGWTWASAAETVLLLSSLTPLPVGLGTHFQQVLAPWADRFFDAVGFAPTSNPGLGTTFRSTFGLSSSIYTFGETRYGVVGYLSAVLSSSVFDDVGVDRIEPIDFASADLGGWFRRPAPVPLPGGASLLAVSLVSVLVLRSAKTRTRRA